jgi:hypothetical protein
VAPKVKKLDQQAIIRGFAARIWFHDKQNKFYYRNPNSEELIVFTETVLKEFLAGQGFYSSILKLVEKERGPLSAKEEKKVHAAAWIRLLDVIVKRHRVDWVGELAGYPRGEHTINGAKILVPKGYKLLEPVKGDPSFVLKFMNELLPNDQDFYAHTWLLDRYEGLLHPEKYTPAQALIIGGMAGDGKTLFKRRIVREILGGRGGDAISYYIGDDSWNDDLAKLELHEIDDQGDTHNYDRYVYTNNLKKGIADPDMRIRTRYQSAVTIPLKTAIIVLFNTEARNYALLPEDTGDIRDKLIVLKSAKATLPESSTEIESRIAEALPAYIYWLLNEFQVPSEIRTQERFRIVAYKNPEILEAIQETSPATLLGELLQEFVEGDSAPRPRESASWIYGKLVSESSWRPRLEKICRSFGRFTQLMTELSKQKGSGVSQGRSDGKRYYEIKRLRTPKPPKAPNIVAMTPPENGTREKGRKNTRKRAEKGVKKAEKTQKMAQKPPPRNVPVSKNRGSSDFAYPMKNSSQSRSATTMPPPNCCRGQCRPSALQKQGSALS